MLDCNYLVVGAGQTGLVIAQELAGLGKKVILVEQGEIGGSYLFSYDIPKLLLQKEAKQFNSTLKVFKDHPDTFTVLRKFRQKINSRILSDVKKKQKQNELKLEKLENLKIVYGSAEFSSKSLAEVNSETERHLVSFEKCILATGNNTILKPSITGIDKVKFLHKHNAYLFDEIPSQIGIIGVTVENLELADIYSSLGVKVQIFEELESARSLKKIDRSGLNYLLKQLISKQVEFNFKTKITKVTKDKNGIILIDAQKKEHLVSHIFVDVEENFDGESLGLSKIEISSTKKGINVNSSGLTDQKHIWAFGECASKCTPQNKYSSIYNYTQKLKTQQEEKKRGVKLLAGINFNILPEITPVNLSVIKINTDSPVLSVGFSELEAIARLGSHHIRTTVVDHDLFEGFAKLIVKQSSGQILGITLAGDFCIKLENYMIREFPKNLLYRDFRNFLRANWGI